MTLTTTTLQLAACRNWVMGCLRGDVGIATGVPRIAADSELGRVGQIRKRAALPQTKESMQTEPHAENGSRLATRIPRASHASGRAIFLKLISAAAPNGR